MNTGGMRQTLVSVLLSIFVWAGFAAGQEPSPTTAGTTTGTEQAKVFVFVQRTDRHGKYSKSEVFHEAKDDLLAYLKEKNVAVAVDEFGGRNYAESATPMETVFKIARDAKANNVLYVVVDRPMSKWIKITAQCYDMNEKQLWTEEASNASSMSGGDALKSTKKRLRERLENHIGKTGLPVAGSIEAVGEKK